MLAERAIISGSLGQALFRLDGSLRLLERPDGDVRDPTPNEVWLFRNVARETCVADPEGLPVSLKELRARLAEERSFFEGLDGLLVGMDPDFSDELREAHIRAANRVLESNAALARRIHIRFLTPVNSQEWDPEGAQQIAASLSAKAATRCYRAVAERVVDAVLDDIFVAAQAQTGSGRVGWDRQQAFVDAGIIADLVLAETDRDQTRIQGLIFRKGELAEADPNGQILMTAINRAKERVGTVAVPKDEEEDAGEDTAVDPIIDAVEAALKEIQSHKRRDTMSPDDVEVFKKQIGWVVGVLQRGHLDRAEKSICEVIELQGRRSRHEDLVKTLTNLANAAISANAFDLASRLCDAINRVGRGDAPALLARGNLYRALGQHDDALGVFKEVIDLFPNDEVAPPARAETLRAMGRHDDALAAFEDVIARFPNNEVARNARAHLLASTGNLSGAREGLGTAIETPRTHHDWTGLHIWGMAMLRADRVEEALAVFRRGSDECSFAAQLSYFRSALAVTQITLNRAAEAVQDVQAMLDSTTVLPMARTNLILFKAHALAELQIVDDAEELVRDAMIVDLASERQKRLGAALTQRYGLLGHAENDADAEALSAEILSLEIDLLTPDTFLTPEDFRRAA